MGLESVVAGILNKTRLGKKAFYPLLGILPSDFQEKLAEDINAGKRIFMFSQIAFATGVALARYAIGDLLNNYETTESLGIAGKIWSIGSFIVNSARVSYSVITKRPVGVLTMELPYRIFKRSKRAERIIEKYVLN